MKPRLFGLFATLIVAVLAGACSSEMSPEQAREAIADAQVPFDASGLVAVIGAGDNEMLRLFLIAGIDPEIRDGDRPTALELAAARANLPAVEMLIEAGADPAEHPGILNVAAARGDVATLALLLENGADIEGVDHLRQTALAVACDRVSLESGVLLLERGADPNARFGRGERPLLTAIKRGSFELAAALVEAGADVDIVGGTPRTTPLILASQLGQLETVTLLLENGADRTKDLSGQTALRAARHAGHAEVVRLLEETPAN